MKNLRILLKKGFLILTLFFLVFISNLDNLNAEETKWVEVARANNEIQFIDVNTINYKHDLLSVIIKHSEINSDDQKDLDSYIYKMGIDCENRLFSKLQLQGDVNEVKNWINPNNDKLTKLTIINSCYY